MRIGVLTFSGSDDNYGQILQCYALQVYLRELGHDVYLIKYNSDIDNNKERFHRLKHILRLFLSLVSPSRKKAYSNVLYYKKLRNMNAEKNKQRKFQEFLYDNVNVSPVYNTYYDLVKNAPLADVYIVGSDQVWNIDLSKKFAAAWYLQFGKKEIRRISYAASIGRTMKKNERRKFTEYLKNFYALSVRENTTLEYCHKVGMKNVQLVLDPTLLISSEKYKSFVSVSNEKPYVFLYYINVDNIEALEWKQLNRYILKEHLNLRTVSSSGYFPACDLIPGYKNELLTIPEWLTAIYGACSVITTSFHGIVFSIIMHRPFVAILLKNCYSAGNDRIVSLLKYLKLDDRILSDSNTIDAILSRQIKWNEVDVLIDKKRKDSFAFLAEALR